MCNIRAGRLHKLWRVDEKREATVKCGRSGHCVAKFRVGFVASATERLFERRLEGSECTVINRTTWASRSQHAPVECLRELAVRDLGVDLASVGQLWVAKVSFNAVDTPRSKSASVSVVVAVRPRNVLVLSLVLAVGARRCGDVGVNAEQQPF